MAHYKILGGSGFLGKYYFDPKEGTIKLKNVFEDVNSQQVWQNSVPGYEVIQMLEEVQKVKDIQNGLLLKFESLTAQYKRLTHGV